MAKAVSIASIFIFMISISISTTEGFMDPCTQCPRCEQSMISARFLVPYQPRPNIEQYPETETFLYSMAMMLNSAMVRLQALGYGRLSVALLGEYDQLVGLHNMTLFALDDASLHDSCNFNIYLRNLRFHIVPNMLLTASDLERLPPLTELPTMKEGKNLVVHASAPLRISNVNIETPDVLRSYRIAIHGLSHLPFSSDLHDGWSHLPFSWDLLDVDLFHS